MSRHTDLERSERHKLLIAAAMNSLDEVSTSLKSVPGTFEIRCLIDDEVIVQLRDTLLSGVESEWRARARDSLPSETV